MDSTISIPLPGRPIAPGGDRNPCLALPDFLAGPENRLVEPAVRSVLDDPPGGYNPLVFYGPGGTGKSHLARGLAAQWRARYPCRRVLCTTAADFARELADAVETQATDEFRNRYRKAALLILEDIGRLAGKYDAQEELVHTLDTLLATGRRVVVTASAAPARLGGIAHRLGARLDCGLTILLAPPGAGARLTLLHQLARLQKIQLSEPAAAILAKGLPLTVPELLNVLLQLEIPARLQGGSIDAGTAGSFLALRNGAQRAGLRDIAVATARLFALRPSDLRGPSRRQAVVTARGAAMYLARQLTPKSLKQIGDYFGGRDHSTVVYGCRKTEELLENDPTINQAVQQLQQSLQHTSTRGRRETP